MSKSRSLLSKKPHNTWATQTFVSYEAGRNECLTEAHAKRVGAPGKRTKSCLVKSGEAFQSGGCVFLCVKS